MRTTTVLAAALLSTTALAADSKPQETDPSSSAPAPTATDDSTGPARLFSDEAIYAAAQATATSANKALEDFLRTETAIPSASVDAEIAHWNSAIIKGDKSAPLPAITALPKSLANYESLLYAGEKSIIQHDVTSGEVLTGSAASQFIVFATESAPSVSKSGASTMATATSTPSGSAGGSSTSSSAPKPSSGAEGRGRGSSGVAVFCMGAVAGLAGFMSMM